MGKDGTRYGTIGDFLLLIGWPFFFLLVIFVFRVFWRFAFIRKLFLKC